MPASEYDYTLISFDAVQSTLDYICNYADSKLDGKDLNKGIIPINVCAHCGPGTIGLVVSKKINGKPLASFVK